MIAPNTAESAAIRRKPWQDKPSNSGRSQYGQARLRLGMAAVGSLTFLAFTGMATGWPVGVFPDQRVPVPYEMLALILFALGWLALMFPFDIVGGYLLPVRDGRCAPSLRSWLNRWIKSTCAQAAILFMSLSIVLWAARLGGKPLAIAAIFTWILIVFASYSAWFHWRVRREAPRHESTLTAVRQVLLRWRVPEMRLGMLSHHDVGFTGGVVGLPGHEMIILPAMWKSALTSEELAAVVARRAVAVRSGYRVMGWSAALGWNVLGFAMTALIFGGNLTSVSEVVMTSLGTTCWSFLGLLLLPTPSRRAAVTVDRLAVQSGVPRDTMRDVLGKLDRMQDDEPERKPLVETIFHPVPSLNRRLAQLDGVVCQASPPRIGRFWNVARTAIPLSLATTGLLSRAVHCNSGRPELWWLLPLD